MEKDTIGRSDLVEAVYQAVGLSKVESMKMVSDMIDIICDTLISGEQVKLSSFGTFQVRNKRSRMGRNPKTGEEVPIDARRVLVFKPSGKLKSRIDKSLKD